jgi:2-polyprenyl-6-methoxyphenol hydroxylase-like FAD-dependent oxidoreductase
MVLLERQTLLRLMYEKIRDKTQIRTDSRVVAVKESPSGVEVVTQQGTLYHGKIGVGADGVHSRIRACIALELEGQEVKTNLNSCE